MLALGLFVFALPTVAYETLERSTAWRHASNSRIGAMPAYQYVGKGEDTITLAGKLLPELTGFSSLDLVRGMANTGKAYVLLSLTGKIYGAFVIEDLNETQSFFFVNGSPQKTDFKIKLKCVDDSKAKTLLDVLSSPLGGLGSMLDWGV